MSTRVPLFAWFMSLLFAVVFASLAFIALSEQSISLASRSKAGVSHHSGQSAVIVGYMFAAAAIASLAIPAARSRFRALVYSSLVVLWLVLVISYHYSHAAP